MTSLRSGAEHFPTPRIRFDARAVAIALAAALAVTLTALVIVLATSSGGSEPVRVAPTSGTTPPSPAERDQPPGLDGPGMRP
jgi:hypothetical protein